MIYLTIGSHPCVKAILLALLCKVLYMDGLVTSACVCASATLRRLYRLWAKVSIGRLDSGARPSSLNRLRFGGAFQTCRHRPQGDDGRHLKPLGFELLGFGNCMKSSSKLFRAQSDAGVACPTACRPYSCPSTSSR